MNLMILEVFSDLSDSISVRADLKRVQSTAYAELVPWCQSVCSAAFVDLGRGTRWVGPAL